MKAEKLKPLLKIFLIIYPIFSMTFIYNSYFTLLQIGIIFLLLLITLIKNKDSRKNIKYLIIYYLIVGIYGILHHWNATNFHSLVPDNFNYNCLDEVLYLFKMSIPIPFIYLIYYSNLSKKDYLDILKSWLLIICGTIIITNITKISLGSYTNTTIKGSIFNWFDKSLIYKEMASRGFFVYANQISCLLVCMIPSIIYFYFKEKLNYKYLIILLLTLLMLGTRISNIAGILVFDGMIFLYIAYNFITKAKIKWSKVVLVLVFTGIYLSILPFSPTSSRYQVYDYLLANNHLIANSENTNIDDLTYIKNNYEALEINENFILNSYPYEYDSEFWLKILREPIEKRTDYRYLEIEMVKRVITINNNKMDSILGITNDRIQNIFNIERGYILEYYAYGFIGVIIFLGIYICIFIRNGLKTAQNFQLFNICLLASSFLLLVISYLSGNIFESINIFIPLILLIFGPKNLEKT